MWWNSLYQGAVRIRVSLPLRRGVWRVVVLCAIVLLCITTPGYAMDVTLGWDANTDTELAGYIICYKTGSPGPPFDVEKRV